MNKNLLATAAAFLILAISCTLYAQERNTDALMGMAIQNYLEGNFASSIDHLDGVLMNDPGNTRARDLMERSATRLAEQSDADSDLGPVMGSLRKALNHLPGSDALRKSLQTLVELAGLPEEEPAKAPAAARTPPAPAPVQPAPVITPPAPVQPAAARTAPAQPSGGGRSDAATEELQRRIRGLTLDIKNIDSRLSEAAGTNQRLLTELDEIRQERSLMMAKLEMMSAAPKQRNIPAGFILIGIVLAGGAGSFFLYSAYTGGNSRIEKSLAMERQAIEDLKSSYNKDTEKLAQKLTEYGKARQKAGDLEQNWSKMIGIVERLSRGGSTKKLVISDHSGNRKAVTGVDPRTRARADSVEVIAEIFRDSPRAADMIKPFLEDADNRTRANAAVSYHRYDPEKAMAVLHEMAEDKDKWMRISAAWALGEIGDASTSRVLEKLLDDTDSDVKNKARLSLEKLLGRDRKV